MLDPESVKFIEWVKEELEDPVKKQTIIDEILTEARDYLENDPNFIEALITKLTLGGEEHGAPNQYTYEEATNELKKEYQDLVGWGSIRKRYCKQNTEEVCEP